MPCLLGQAFFQQKLKNYCTDYEIFLSIVPTSLSILTYMQVTEILRTAKEHSGMSSYEIAELSGVSEATISRILSGKNNPTFSSVEHILESIGFTLSLIPATAFQEITVQNLIGTINQHADTADQWLEVSRVMRELIEFPPSHFPHLSHAVMRLPSTEWRAFLAGFYLHQGWLKNKEKYQHLALPTSWTPLPRLRKSATTPNESFAYFNVLIPHGELEIR